MTDLAEQVRAFFAKWDGNGTAWTTAIPDLREALAALGSAQAGGERVRAAVWRGDKPSEWTIQADYDPKDSAWDDCPPPDFYVEFIAPPRAEVPTVSGTVCDGK